MNASVRTVTSASPLGSTAAAGVGSLRGFRFSIAPELAPFQPEIDHVIRLLGEAYGLVPTDGAGIALHYGPNPPAGALHIPAALFPAAILTSPAGLHLDRAKLDAMAGSLLPAGPADRWDARQFDAIGLIFLVASRVEERDSTALDRYGRYPLEADFCYRNGVYGRPVADDALLAIARLVTGDAIPASRTAYRLKVTHDVDRLRSFHYWLEPLRYALGDVVKRGSPRTGLQRLSAYTSGEPWRSVTDLLALSERYGLTSHFYLMGPSRSSFDSPYVITMTDLLRRVVTEIQRRGHVIGFHPGHGTASNAAAWQHQRTGLENNLGLTLYEGRQHMLAYAAAETPDIWDDAGMTDDYTLAYPEAEGFRNGSCRSLPAYSLQRRQTLRLRQTSTAIMEFGLFGGKYRGLDADAALDACRPVIAACRQHGGTLTVLYHTGQPDGAMRQFYGDLLAQAS